MTPLAAGEELQVPGCYPYGVRASGSERKAAICAAGSSCGPIEKVPMLGLRLGSGWTAGTGSLLVVRCALLCWEPPSGHWGKV